MPSCLSGSNMPFALGHGAAVPLPIKKSADMKVLYSCDLSFIRGIRDPNSVDSVAELC